MLKGNLSRRGFMQRSLAGMAAAGLPAWYAQELFAAEAQAAQQAERRVAANDKIVVGLIGCGGQGRGIMNAARNDKRVQVVAVCDVDRGRRDDTAKTVGKDCATFEDFRQLLDRKDINAVLIGTPDHWHTLIAIDAMRKGKDVYCEKPLTLTVAEGQALTRVARQTKTIFQVGSQQRSDARFRLACELVRNGRIGKIKTVETRIGDNPVGGPFAKADVPAGLNWDFWQGPTPRVDYVRERCHYTFRWWYEYSGGKMTDWGAHHNDIAQWGLGTDDSGPISVTSLAAEPARDGMSYNCHPRFLVTYTYANGAKLLCSDRQLPNSLEDRHDNGVLFVGEGNQWIFVNRGLIEASDQAERPMGARKGVKAKAGGPSKLLDTPLDKEAVRLYVSSGHMRNWLDGIQNRRECVCTAEIGHRSATVCHIGAISQRLGGVKRLAWDPKKETFDDPAATRMLSREMRGEWKLPT